MAEKHTAKKEIRRQKKVAVGQIDLMHEAIAAGKFKKAINHHKAADIAIDDMVAASDMTKKK